MAETYNLKNASPEERARVRRMLTEDGKAPEAKPKSGPRRTTGPSLPRKERERYDRAHGESESGTVQIVPAFIRRDQGRRVLLAEVVTAMLLITLGDVAQGEAPTFRSYVGAFVVYIVLGTAAELGGDDVAHLAAGFGGLVLLAIGMRAAPAFVALGQVAGGTTPAWHDPRAGNPAAGKGPLQGPPPNRPGSVRANSLGGS